MVDQSEAFAGQLVRALYYATYGKPVWWSLPKDLNEVTRRALECASITAGYSCWTVIASVLTMLAASRSKRPMKATLRGD